MCNLKNNLHPKIFFKLLSNFSKSLNFVAPSASAKSITLPLALNIPLNKNNYDKK